MVTKECFGCEKVTSHEHFHDCAPGNPETHIAGSERFVCVLCGHVTFAGSEGASRFPFTFDKVAAGRLAAGTANHAAPPACLARSRGDLLTDALAFAPDPLSTPPPL